MTRTVTIYAKDGSAAAIADAFARQATLTRQGPYGQIGDQPMIVIPMAAGPAARTRAVVRPQAPHVQPAPVVTALQRLRGHPYAIGGYVAVFDREYQHNGVRQVVKPGAFTRALAAGDWFLLADHRASAVHDRPWMSPIRSVSPSRVLASMDAGTLHVEEDPIGLWCEAALPMGAIGRRLIEQLKRGEILGLSAGSTSATGRLVQGVQRLDQIAAWEISLCLENPPARVGSWVDLLGVAQQRRRQMTIAAEKGSA